MKLGVVTLQKRTHSSGLSGPELLEALEGYEATFEEPVKEKLSPGNVPELTLFINAVREVLGLGPLPFSVNQGRRKGEVQRWNCW